MTEWSVHEYENWLELDSSFPSTSPSLEPSTPSSTSFLLSAPPGPTDGHEAQESLTPLFLFSTILPLLSLTNSLPPPTSNTTTSPLSQIDYLSQVSLSRSELLPSSRSEPFSRKILAKGSLYLVDSVSRIALNSYKDKNLTSTGIRSKRSKEEGGGARKDGEGFEEEWKKRIEERLEKLEGRTKETTTRNELQGRVDEEVKGLRRRVEELEAEKKEWTESCERGRTQRSLLDHHSKTSLGGTLTCTKEDEVEGGPQLESSRRRGTWLDRNGANTLAVCWGLGFGIIISKWIGFLQ